MEIPAMKCNECGARAYREDEGSGNWAEVIVTVPALRLERRMHLCPPCFNTWNDKMSVSLMGGQHYDPDLARLLREEEDIERRAQPPIPPPPPNPFGNGEDKTQETTSRQPATTGGRSRRKN